MWILFSLMALSSPAPAAPDELALTNVRATYGLQGPTRPDSKFLPGDSLSLAFDIAGAKTDASGKIRYGIGLEVTDSQGKTIFQRAPTAQDAAAPPAGKNLPAYASLHIGLDQPPGNYKLKISVQDLSANATRELVYPLEVLPPGFGVVQVITTADSERRVPATAYHQGQSFWIAFDLVGFTRAKANDQPGLAVALRVLDSQGKEALPKPLSGEVSDGVPPKVQAVPLQFVVRLQQVGAFTVELKATDKAAGKSAVVAFPVKVVAAQQSKPATGSVVAAAGTGTLLQRGASTKSWSVVPPKAALEPGQLVVGLPGATIDSGDGGVRLTMHADLGEVSPSPVIESALVLRGNPRFDLDFSLDRGRVDVVNVKKSGLARIQVRIQQELWELTLVSPGAQVGMELFCRRPRGILFRPGQGSRVPPTAHFDLLVVKGEVILKHGGHEYLMQAPPGPALMEWDSVNGQDDTPQRLEKLPDWVGKGGPGTPEAKAVQAAVERLQTALAAKPLDAVLKELVSSADVRDRRTALLMMAALDDLPRLSQTVRDAKQSDVTDTGILALRHWIGRAPGQEQKLYDGLIEHANLTPPLAGAVLQLLHTPSEAELAQPEVYQALVDYLSHDLPLLRALAYWHLYRLVPAGRPFGYNALDSQDKREAAVQGWRKLIQPGQLPPGVRAMERPK